MNLKTLTLIFSFILISAASNAQGTKKLFNGKDLSGWTVHGAEKWYVENGNLICESGPKKEYGYLSTNKSYRGWLTKPTAEEESGLSPEGWNKGKIEVNNDEITTWLNGKQISHLKDEKFGKGDGFIALQIHSGGGIKVRWKNIKIKEQI